MGLYGNVLQDSMPDNITIDQYAVIIKNYQ
jgi:hypothetical protein